MIGQGALLMSGLDAGQLGGGLSDVTEAQQFHQQEMSRLFEDPKSDVDKAEEETSSASTLPSANGTRKASGGPGAKYSAQSQQQQNGGGSVQDLRDLTSRGVCAPLWRTNHSSYSQGQLEPTPHLLQTCWVRYQGEAAARRTSMWNISESGNAMQAFPNSRSSSFSAAQHAPLQDLISKYSSGNLGPSDSLDIQRSLSGLSNRGQRSGQPLAGRSTSLMSMPCDNGVASMGLPLEHRSSTLGVSSCAAGAATFLHPMSQRNTNVFGSSSGMGVRQNPQAWGYGLDNNDVHDFTADQQLRTSLAASAAFNNGNLMGLNTGNPAQALIQSKHQEGPVKTLPVQLQQELERHRTAQSKWDGDKFGPQNGGWPLDVQARSFVQNGLNFGTAPMPEGLGRGMNDYRGLEMASRSLDPRDAGPMAPGTPFPAYGVGQQPSAGLPDSMLPMDLSPGVRATSLNDMMDPVSGRLLTQLPERVIMALTAAPTMFAVPTCINKGFNPPFVIRVAVVSAVPTQIKATVAAYVVQKETVANLDSWHPATHVVTESLSGAVVTQTIVCHGPHKQFSDHAPGKHQGVGEFKFTDLKFHSSSRMKPRWLLFALTLPTDDVIFCQYTVPTIVMSRQCDQASKALLILKGQVPSKKRGKGDLQGMESLDDDSNKNQGWPISGPYDMNRWREAVERTSAHYAILRPFDRDDLLMLARVAGYEGNKGQITAEQWTQFGRWFTSYLRLFRCHQSLWAQTNPKAICGFGVDRAQAEALLDGQPDGTFLVRPSMSLAGTMVISAVTDGRVKHMALDGNQLDSRSLEVWVRDVCEATHVLNTCSGNHERVPKEKVFLLNYSRIGVSNDLALGSGQMFSSISPNLQSMPSHRGSVGSPYNGAGGSAAFPQETTMLLAGNLSVSGLPGTLTMSRGSPPSNMSDGS